MTQSLNRDWYDELVRAIARAASGRRPTSARRSTAGRTSPRRAVKAGLVDALAYEDQLDDEAPIAGTQRFDGETSLRACRGRAGRGRAARRIALLYAVGTIASGKSAFDGPGGSVVGSDTFVQWMRKVRVDAVASAPSSSAIDSPGGSAIASEVIWREMMLTRDVKPVIVSMGDVAASGGYYIAAPAHTIVAQPGTLTGSIGVVTGKFVLKGALDKIGVGAESVTDGRVRRDLLAVPAVHARGADARRRADAGHLRAVPVARRRGPASRRGAGSTPLRRAASGPAVRPANCGLVDELGGLDDAIRIAKDARQARRRQGRRPGGLSAEAVVLRGAVQSVRPSATTGLEVLLQPAPSRRRRADDLGRFRARRDARHHSDSLVR